MSVVILIEHNRFDLSLHKGKQFPERRKISRVCLLTNLSLKCTCMEEEESGVEEKEWKLFNEPCLDDVFRLANDDRNC